MKGAGRTGGPGGIVVAPMGGAVDTMVWLTPEQHGLARRCAELAGLSIVSAGFPRGIGRVDQAGEALRSLEVSAAYSDIRHEAATTAARLLLVLTAAGNDGERSGAVLDDASLLSACAARGIEVVTLEPAPASVSAMVSGGPDRPIPVRLAPLLRDAPEFAQARDAVQVVAPVRSVLVSISGGPGEGSLGARLVDAVAALDAVLGEPESVDACVSSPGVGAGVHVAPASSVRGLKGDLAASLRYSSASASVWLSDRAGPWRREVRIVGERGGVVLCDGQVRVFTPGGEAMDADGNAPAATAGESLVAAVARSIRAAIERRALSEAVDWVSVLATAEAAVLSARTGQNESPRTIVRMSAG